jgi:hypothetical protein
MKYATAFFLAATVAVWPGHAALGSAVHELASALVIAKSSNRNQVHYAVAVDDSCAPIGAAPVHPYWRMLERGPSVTEALQASEERVLGIEGQQVSDGTVRFSVRGLPGRTFYLHTSGTNGRCSSSVETTIAGHLARVDDVFVQQKLFGMIDYVRIEGTTADGARIQERLTL